MSLLSTKGVVAGVVLATTGSLSLFIAPAQATPTCATATLSTFASPCLLPGGGGITLTISGATDPNAALSVASNGAFGAFGNGLPSGSFAFNVTAAPNTFFNFADLLSFSPATITTNPSIFTFTNNGDNFSNSDTALTSISGTYSYSSSPLVANSLKFTTDVPLPLPVVGAGLAFGFTRNLRKRAKLLT